MTAVDGPAQAETVVDRVVYAMQRHMRWNSRITGDERCSCGWSWSEVESWEHHLAAALRDAGLLPTGDTTGEHECAACGTAARERMAEGGDDTVEWGVRSPYGMQLGGVAGELHAREVAVQLPGRTVVTRTVTPWVPEQPPSDESETDR